MIAAPAWARGGKRETHGAMLLSRLLTRSLSDGAQITVFRQWEISITRRGIGWAVDGRQVAVEVEAPKHIAAIADVERRRSTDSTFPILLGSNKQILAAGQGEGADDLELAVREAERVITAAPLSVESKQQRRLLLKGLQGAGNSMLERWPKDLFYPQTTNDHQVRRISLPDGSAGEFELALVASADAQTGLLKRMERTITTRLHGSEQQSSESWELEHI